MGAVHLIDPVTIEARAPATCPISGAVVFYSEAGKHRAIKRMFFWIDDDSYVAMPDNQVSGLRCLHTLERINAVAIKDIVGISIFVIEPRLSVDSVHEMRTVGFRGQTPAQFPRRLHNYFAFFTGSQPDLLVLLERLDSGRDTQIHSQESSQYPPTSNTNWHHENPPRVRSGLVF